MAVSYVHGAAGKAQNHSTGVSSITIGSVVVSGPDQYMLVFGRSSNNDGPTGVTFNGSSLTSGWSNANSVTGAYGGVPASTGTANVVVSFGSAAGDLVAVVFTFSGVDGTTPYVSPITESGETTQYPSRAIDTPPTNGIAFVGCHVHAWENTLSVSGLSNVAQDYQSGGGGTICGGTASASGTATYGNLGLSRDVYHDVIYLNPVSAAAYIAPPHRVLTTAATRRSSEY